MDVEIRTLPTMRAAVVRHVGPYHEIGAAFGRLGAIAGPAGLFALPGAGMVALYHADAATTPAAELRSEAGVLIPEGTALPAGLEAESIPAGRYACTKHVGPYQRLGETWAAFMREWLPASGHRMGPGPSFERYLNDPMRTPPEQLETELYISIQ